MDISSIRMLVGEANPDLFKALTFGHLRGLQDGELYELIHEHTFEIPLGTWIFRCFLDKARDALKDKLARELVESFERPQDYKAVQRLAFYLNKLFDFCSQPCQRLIATTLLRSEKRSCRKYAYSKRLEDVGEDLAELAWDRAKGKTDDERSFIHTAAYHYSDSFIERHFRELTAASGAEEYQLRKLFSRKRYIETQEWLWLESNLPITFVYLAALRGHTLSDEQCISLYRTARMAEVAKNSWRFPEDVLAHGYNGLLLWCFARMNKWSVVRSLLADLSSGSDVA